MDEKVCPRCKGNLKISLDFCTHCGYELSIIEGVNERGGRKRVIELLAIALVLLLSGAGYLTFWGQRENPEGGAGPNVRTGMAGGGFDAEADSVKFPETYGDLVQLGNNLMDQHIYEMAVNAYSRALALDSTDPDVITDMGVCFYALGKSQQAIDIFERAIKLDSGHVITYFNLGIVHREMNNGEKARMCWTKVIELQPNQPISDTVRKYLKEMVE